MTRVQIVFEPEGKRVTVPQGTSIFDAAKRIGIKIRTECGGKGSCAKCIVLISDPDSVNPPTKFEKDRIGKMETLKGKRLACLTRILSDTKVQILKTSRIGQRRVQVDGLERNVEIKPSIKKIVVSVDSPTLNDLRSDIERLLDAVRTQGIEVNRFDHHILRNLSEILRESSGKVITVIRKGEELIEVKKRKTLESTLGFAVDIGTSKIVATLVDLETGWSLASGFIENPQMIFGEDVISRIGYAMSSHSQLQELHRAVIDGIQETIETALGKVGASIEDVFELVVVGNTAMHHLFLGIDPQWLARAPYVPTIKRGMELKAKDLGLNMRDCVRIHLPPIIAGFVGSDALADLLTLQLHKSDKTSLALDIGTNTEVFLADKGEVLTCSCASGPAFEGVHILHGMKAVSGAIERLRIDSRNRVSYTTIDQERPKGICGSGVIDLVANLLKRDLIERNGRFKGPQDSSRIRRRDGILEFVVEEEVKTAMDQDIVFTQQDLRAIQLARAAIRTGWKILLEEMNLKPSDLDAVYLAGAFGTFLDAGNAKTIGLVPEIDDKRIFFVGNTAVSGAKIALISLQEREEMDVLARETRYLELGAHPTFNDVFTDSLSF